MDVTRGRNLAPAGIAAAIGDPARSRMLYALLDQRARTSTELAALSGVNPPTASAHLKRLTNERLVVVEVQGRYRYYRLAGADVARVLEGLSVLAGTPRPTFVPSTPHRLRFARTCYDHLAGTLGVLVHERLASLGCFRKTSTDGQSSYALTRRGSKALEALGVDVPAALESRRQLAFACLDWSERQPHVGGAIGAELLRLMLKRRWVESDLDSRALTVTALGRRECQAKLGLILPPTAR